MSLVLAHAFPVTIRLALIAVAVEAVLGVGFGVIAGLRQGGVFDATVLITGLVIIAIPIFVLGFLAQFVFGVRLGIAPVTVGGRATFGRMLLPGIVLGSVSFAYVVRLTRSAVAANAHTDYVRTATAKGLSRPRVVTVHILRNSLIPVVTFLGADLGALMGGAIMTEGIFNIHGVGGVLYQAVTRQEAPTVVSIVTVLVLSGDSRLSHNVPDLRALLERTLDRASAERLDELLVVADDQFFERRQLFELVRAQGAGNEPPPGGDPAGLAAFFSVRPYCNFVTVVPDNAVVPRHRVLPPAEFAALRLARETLPVVFDSDPPVVWEGGRAGQVVEITRDSQPNVVELAYRRIEAAP